MWQVLLSKVPIAKTRRRTSGGERNRLKPGSYAQAGGNLLLLTEPTNDLDIENLGKLGSGF